MNGEEKPDYECKSIIEFKIMVIARLGILRRRVSRGDWKRESGTTEHLGRLDPIRLDHDSLTLTVENLGFIRSVGNLKSVDLWVSGFWGGSEFFEET